MINALQGGVNIDQRCTEELPPLSPKTDAIALVEPETVNELQLETAETSERERKHTIFYSTSAKKYHRLPRSNADKRNQVELLLSAPEWQKMSDRAIAEHCNVSAPFVGKIRAELAHKGTVNLFSERVDRKGRRIETANIGTQPKSRQDKSTPIKPDPYQELHMIAAELVRTQEASRQLEAENQHLREEIAHFKAELARWRSPQSES